MMFAKLLRFWKKAASDLGLILISPYSLLLPSGQNLEALFLVQQFGASKGMLVFGNYDDVADYINEVTASGYGFSVLDEPTESEEYNVEEYIELLMDWGWSGEEQLRPNWYR